MPKFTVDTHLFRELGELLVGRDSTALVELIKNAYDADATSVVVYGEALDDLKRGFVRITDNGMGMTSSDFENGFLRIASRLKEQGDRVSRLYERRFTGAKGIGRLAAHKLARVLEVDSISTDENVNGHQEVVEAKIDWSIIEKYQTLDDIDDPEAIVVNNRPVARKTKAGTTITLSKIRRSWSTSERSHFLAEVQSFETPKVLFSALPKSVVNEPLLFERPKIRNADSGDPGFHIELEGDFAIGEDYWQSLAQAADWVIEIDAQKTIQYCAAPTRKIKKENPWAEKKTFSEDHPDPHSGPFFQSRILIREGRHVGSIAEQTWAKSAAGIRLFMEGFRVLPYGEPGNDWLSIDVEYARRTETTPWMEDTDSQSKSREDRRFYGLPNRDYFGAIWLTQENAPSLRMLVNREGFIPEAGYEHLVNTIRNGIHLSTRVRAAVGEERRRQEELRKSKTDSVSGPPTTLLPTRALEHNIDYAALLTHEARQLVAAGDLPGAKEKIAQVTVVLENAKLSSGKVISEGAMLGVLASVGTQMAAFVHEINGLLGMSQALEAALGRLREDKSLPRNLRSDLAKVHSAIGDLRRNLERQASYLIDVVSPDARRRRSRQSLADRFEAGKRLVERSAEKRSITILNEIPPDLKSPSMFPAELTTIFSNLLTNAVKAAGENGRIRTSGTRLEDGSIRILIENTGTAVKLDEGERWFKPFESTTVNVDPILGQGMGLGLPITSNMLAEYGAEIRFVRPSKSYATAVEILFPK